MGDVVRKAPPGILVEAEKQATRRECLEPKGKSLEQIERDLVD